MSTQETISTNSKANAACRLTADRELRASSRIGQRFGMLTIVDWKWATTRYGTRREIVYLCKCDCSSEKPPEATKYSQLKALKKRTCGCKQIFIAARSGSTTSYKLLYRCWAFTAARTHKNKKLAPAFILLEKWRQLVEQPCFYCTQAPPMRNPYLTNDGALKAYNNNMSDAYTATLWVPLQGIDRYYNNVGYIEGNCVPCCMECNRMKRDMDGPDFLALVEKMVRAINKNEHSFSSTVQSHVLLSKC